MSLDAVSASPFYTEDHEAFRDQVRRFVQKEITPFVEQWEAAGVVPRELHKQAASLGLLGLGYPVELGGNGLCPRAEHLRSCAD